MKSRNETAKPTANGYRDEQHALAIDAAMNGYPAHKEAQHNNAGMP